MLFEYHRDLEIITNADVNIGIAPNKLRNKIVVALDVSASNLYYSEFAR